VGEATNLASGRFLFGLGSAGCQPAVGGSLPTTTKEDFLVSCQKEQAGSLCSPETRELL